jgi:hypothetical protein
VFAPAALGGGRPPRDPAFAPSLSKTRKPVDQDLPGITLPSVRRAADRLRGQKESVQGEWDYPRVIGFQLDRPNAPRNLTS